MCDTEDASTCSSLHAYNNLQEMFGKALTCNKCKNSKYSLLIYAFKWVTASRTKSQYYRLHSAETSPPPEHNHQSHRNTLLRSVRIYVDSHTEYLSQSMLSNVAFPFHTVRDKMIAVMGISRGYQPLSFNQNRSHLLQYLPASQIELPTRCMEVSVLFTR